MGSPQRRPEVERPTHSLIERPLPAEALAGRATGPAPRLFEERPREILARHDLGAAGVHYTLDPYRGCQLACVYCSARPMHEHLGVGGERWGSGADFATRLIARPEAPQLLDQALQRRRLRGRAVQLSGATDPYQPLEAALGITRACLDVCLRRDAPVGLQTKSALVLRDRDLLLALHRGPGVHVAVSLASLDAARAAALEPGAPPPLARLKIVERLAAAGIPVGISVAPAILGLTDTDIVRMLTAAKDAGASTAFYLRLRLPGLIEPMLVRRVRATLPDRARRVLAGLDGHGTAPAGRRAHAEDPMEQIFCFTAGRLGLAFTRGAPWPSTVAQLEARWAERRAPAAQLPLAAARAPERAAAEQLSLL